MHGDPGDRRWFEAEVMANPEPLSLPQLRTDVVC